MTVNMVTMKINTFLTGAVDIQTDTHSTVIISEPPEGLSVLVVDETRHQLTSMMAFQENVSMLFRATLASRGIVFPLSKGRFKVLVRLKSNRSISELHLPTLKYTISSSPLVNVLKSVLDGLNGQVISNDSHIYEAEIVYEKKPKVQRSKLDDLEIELYDLSKGQMTLIAKVAEVLYVVPKETPMFLESNNSSIYMHNTHHEEFAAQLKPIMNLPKYKHYHIDSEFMGDVQRLDVDNMAKIYVPVFNGLGIHNDDVHRITLRKRSKKAHTGSVVLRLNQY